LDSAERWNRCDHIADDIRLAIFPPRLIDAI